MLGLYDKAVADFEILGRFFVECVYLSVLIIGFGFLVFILFGIVISVYEWIKSRKGE